jgi:hypothetical protein
MPPVSSDAIARFATLPAFSAYAPPRRSLRDFFMAPFRDVDDRAARKAAQQRVEREARDVVMSVAPGQQRRR